MRAWQILGAGERRFGEVGDPVPHDDGVVVRMQAAPVMAQSRAVLDLGLGYAHPPLPFVPGTSGIGVIEQVGQDVRGLPVGQRVFLAPYLVADERVADPTRILIGSSALGAGRSRHIPAAALAMQHRWRDGTFAELAHMPASVVTPLPASLDAVPAERLVGLGKFAIGYGGLLRAGLHAGETVIVMGATGYLGSAAVYMALALGAARVVAAARDGATLDAIAGHGCDRIATITLTGRQDEDGKALRTAAEGAADVALDLIGSAADSAPVAAALGALRQGGRLILMGGTTDPLRLDVREMMMNDWQVSGCFMYPSEARSQIAAMIATGLLDLGTLAVRAFPLAELDAALEAACAMRGLAVTALTMADMA